MNTPLKNSMTKEAIRILQLQLEHRKIQPWSPNMVFTAGIGEVDTLIASYQNIRGILDRLVMCDTATELGQIITGKAALDAAREYINLRKAECQVISGEPDKYAAHYQHCALRRRGDFCTCSQVDGEAKS